MYKIVRCPNYLGEVVFWTGVFVSGVDTLNSVWPPILIPLVPLYSVEKHKWLVG